MKRKIEDDSIGSMDANEFAESIARTVGDALNDTFKSLGLGKVDRSGLAARPEPGPNLQLAYGDAGRTKPAWERAYDHQPWTDEVPRHTAPTGTRHNIHTRTRCQNAAYTSYPL